MADRTTKPPNRAFVIFGGVHPDTRLLLELDTDGAIVIAADSGAVHAHAAELTIDIAVGDFDSIPQDLLEELADTGVRLERHPVAKDATDLELAIDVAIREGAEEITVVGGHGGRVDQSFANAFAIASPSYAHISMHAVLDTAKVSVVHSEGTVSVSGSPGDVVTILPLHGDAVGVTTKGLEYPLNAETLPAGTTRGVSNVLLGAHATVSIDRGTVLVVRPGPEVPFRNEGVRQ